MDDDIQSPRWQVCKKHCLCQNEQSVEKITFILQNSLLSIQWFCYSLVSITKSRNQYSATVCVLRRPPTTTNDLQRSFIALLFWPLLFWRTLFRTLYYNVLDKVLGGTPDERSVSVLDGGLSSEVGGGVGMRTQTGARWTVETQRAPTERSSSVLIQSMTYRSCCALASFISVHSQFSWEDCKWTEKVRM